MNTAEIVTLLNDERVIASHYQDKLCLLVRGHLTTYAIIDDTHDVFDTTTGKWLSIVQTSTGSHRVDNKLSLVMALMNDLALVSKIPKLKNEVFKTLINERTN